MKEIPLSMMKIRKSVILSGTLIAACFVLAACGSSGPIAANSTGKSEKHPYPLNIAVKDRSKPQLAQGRLMMLPFYSSSKLVPPLPTELKGKVKIDAQVAQIRLSIAAPTLGYTTASSWNTTIVSVYSSTPTGTNYRVAMLGGTTCMELSYTAHHAVRYGETTLTGLSRTDILNGCLAATLPASGWRASWTELTGTYPPAHPIRVLPTPKLPLPPSAKTS